MNFVAINGGGTKTEAILFDEKGNITAKKCGEKASAVTGHENTSMNNLESLLKELTQDRQTPVSAVWAGISGTTENAVRHNEYKKLLSTFYPQCSIINVTNDIVNAFRSVIFSGEGVAANVSTGSSVFCVSSDNGIRQIGGWGYLLGDEGSAYDLGRRALICVLRQFDGRGGKTIMTGMIKERVNLPLNEMIPEIYKGGRQKIASFADILLEAAKLRDYPAQKQLEEATGGMAESIRTAGNMLNCSLVRVSLSGAMWKNALYYDMVDHYVGRNYQMLLADRSKLLGAAIMCLKSCGVDAGKEVINRIESHLQ